MVTMKSPWLGAVYGANLSSAERCVRRMSLWECFQALDQLEKEIEKILET